MYLQTNKPITYSVSELSTHIKNLLEDNFTYIKLKGEISGLKFHNSGHIYFNLKDEYAVINAVCFRNYANLLTIKAEDGIEVVITGKITTYNARSNYQILVTNMELAGQGALMEIFEKRKKNLAKLGFFAAEHKQTITKIPEKIAVITSETGAVFHDICHRINDRFPVEIMLYPCKVQGKGAEIDLANAIKYINELDDKPNLIILARGGGSIEDLWCFNEEIIVKAIFASKIAIISAIGHETDTTLADFAADLRAPTPTAAAELATPDKHEIMQKLDMTEVRMKKSITNQLVNFQQRVKYTNLLHPRDSLRLKNTKIINLTEKFSNIFYNQINRIEQKLINAKINKDKIFINLKLQENSLHNIKENLLKAQKNLLTSNISKVIYNIKLLESYSYKNTLSRGFSVVRDQKGKIINSKYEIKFPLNIEFSDGEVKIEDSNKT